MTGRLASSTAWRRPADYAGVLALLQPTVDDLEASGHTVHRRIRLSRFASELWSASPDHPELRGASGTILPVPTRWLPGAWDAVCVEGRLPDRRRSQWIWTVVAPPHFGGDRRAMYRALRAPSYPDGMKRGSRHRSRHYGVVRHEEVPPLSISPAEAAAVAGDFGISPDFTELYRDLRQQGSTAVEAQSVCRLLGRTGAGGAA